jgi:SEC-C motif-containing protein
MKAIPCPCCSNKNYTDCCGKYLEKGEIAPTAEALMRSRYTAYALRNLSYLLTSWHPDTRPTLRDLEEGQKISWLRLKVNRHEQQDESHALVEFEARYKVGGRAYRFSEISRFIRENGRWFYLDGMVSN